MAGKISPNLSGSTHAKGRLPNFFFGPKKFRAIIFFLKAVSYITLELYPGNIILAE
jgi:hypothetical protein